MRIAIFLALIGLTACAEAESSTPDPEQPVIIREVMTGFHWNHQSRGELSNYGEVSCDDNAILSWGGCRCIGDGAYLVSCIPKNESTFTGTCGGNVEAIEIKAVCLRPKYINVIARRYGDQTTETVDQPVEEWVR
jgi:hypothetical protein